MNSLDIKKIRENLNVSQEQLAEMIGVHPRTIQNWESGTAIPKSKHAILRNLQLSKQQYYGGETEHPNNDERYSEPATMDKLIELLALKESSLAKSQEHIDKLLAIISQLTTK